MTQNAKTQNIQKCKIDKKYFQVFSSIVMNTPMKNWIQRPNVSHFKAFDIRNFEYEIRISQKIYNRATITESIYYEIYLNRLYLQLSS